MVGRKNRLSIRAYALPQPRNDLESTIDPMGFRILASARLYFRGGLAKVEMAEHIAPHMDPAHDILRGFPIVRDASPEAAGA
jgi:hypothetical protein